MNGGGTGIKKAYDWKYSCVCACVFKKLKKKNSRKDSMITNITLKDLHNVNNPVFLQYIMKTWACRDTYY